MRALDHEEGDCIVMTVTASGGSFAQMDLEAVHSALPSSYFSRRFVYSAAANSGQASTPHRATGLKSSLYARNCHWCFRCRSRIKRRMSDYSIENLARRLAESVPDGLRSVRDDLENNFRSVLKTGIGKLDLVTREEFEVQEAVLARTREKLETLEAKLEELEKTLL